MSMMFTPHPTDETTEALPRFDGDEDRVVLTIEPDQLPPLDKAEWRDLYGTDFQVKAAPCGSRCYCGAYIRVNPESKEN